jgi:glycosyltransferase involved in cell wall biosynthesis
VIHHDKNTGYGAALQTGIRASLDTGHGLIAFCDADRQFDIESFGTLLAALIRDQADFSIGYRIDRADPLHRRVIGRMWHWLSKTILSYQARDVDCGFKLFTRHMLAAIEPDLHGGYASVSPEIIARAQWAGFSMAEAGLTHHPRPEGKQSGTKLTVMVGSFLHLLRIRVGYTLRTHPQQPTGRRTEEGQS